MKALAVIPGQPNSAHLREVQEPLLEEGSLLCRMLAVGVCGTDAELIAGQYGQAPKESEHLILGHESLGEVLEAPKESGFVKGDLIAGIVRRPDPVPCSCCSQGEWDMCQNGLYTERGIKGLHGFCSELFRIEPGFAVKIDPKLSAVGMLMEPASIVAKAWEQAHRIFSRSTFSPKRVLVTGAGPVGLLAAMMGVQKGYEVHVLDRVKSGPKPELVRRLGAIYHNHLRSVVKRCETIELAIECTGASTLIWQLMQCMVPNGVLCLAGVSSGGSKIPVDIGAFNKEMVLENQVIFGTVNANRRHFEAAEKALMAADLEWLQTLITRRVSLNNWESALQKQKDDVKTVIVCN